MLLSVDCCSLAHLLLIALGEFSECQSGDGHIRDLAPISQLDSSRLYI